MSEKLRHIGIILDGNRRYAEKLSMQPWKGHEEGAKKVIEIVEECLALKINELTLFTFSTENFNRPKIEVEFLMKLFKKGFKEFAEDKKYIDKIKITFAGDKTLFPKEIQTIMASIESKTKNNKDMTVNFAMAYGGRSEIINAVKKIISKKVSLENIDEKIISDNLYIKNDVDLIIRTSGEKRTSGFLPWQGVYAELIFIDKMWPQFTKEDLHLCIDEFNSRKRRFGK